MSLPETPSVFPPIFSTACRKNNILRALITGVLIFLARQAYLITISITTITTTTDITSRIYDWEAKIDENLVKYYSNIFQDLSSDGFLTNKSKTLTVGTQTRHYTAALQESGVINLKSTKRNVWVHFKNDKFDVEFIAHTGLDCSPNPGEFALELSRTLKQEGYLIIHTESQDSYSLNSLLDLFNSFKLIRVKEIGVSHWAIPKIREVVLKKQKGFFRRRRSCSIPGYKRELILNSEPLIVKEPLKPWIELKENIKNFKYLPLMADISFKTRYIYIDVGARNYRSSIGNFFKKKYPKQNKDFKIFAIEADKHFHKEYESKKKITLLPYAAWVRNESLFFEINREPNNKNEEKGRGMGHVQSAQTSTNYLNDLNKIQGFDFANWVKSSFSKRDFVVVKMDVEGTEFDLIKKMIENGAICLIDEMFLECHYNRWQKCCDGERSMKYAKVYKECLELFSLLRNKGVLVHQWW